MKFRISQCFFIIYRAFVAVYVLAWNIALHATWRENAAHSSFYYLSNWIYLLLAIYLIYAFIVTLSYAARPEKQDTTTQRSLDVPLVPRRRRHRKEKRPEVADDEDHVREKRSPERKTAHKSHKIRKHREQIKLRMRHSKNYETRSTKTDASDPLLPENEEELAEKKRSKRASRFLHNGSLLLLPQKSGKSKRARRKANRREQENTQTDRAKKDDPQNEMNKQTKSVGEIRAKKTSKPANNGCQPSLPQTKPKAMENRASTSTSGPASGSNLPQPKDNRQRTKTKKKNSPRASGESPQTVSKGTQTRPEDIKKSMKLTPNQDGDGLASAPKPTPPSVAIKVFWIFHSTACNLSVVITLMVYMVMYPYLGAFSALIQVDAITLNCHGINSLIVLIDLMLSSVPVRILHFVYPAIIGILYVVFSLVYWSLDKYFNVLYFGILDWNDPGIASGISVLLIFVVVPLIQLFLFGLSLLRDLIHDCCTKSSSSTPRETTEESMA
ncbi:hypothetical protein CAPTEDRAFT_224936 [Capitella teleta]|uniref:Uncharacterized protein n=1 Tax=Capitella teleta TaxID=283909 RepID=R7U5E3_CAPTE|nr:hypothetical protein CAPTEDRAFT_224936 [Capitella teleta]|eukprot:ELT98345.1 hypothetical protein CAPTEDRAFT_224936 [Capitella teleta]